MSDPVQAQVTVVPGALDYTTPSAYYPGTLFIYINGILKEQDGVEGVDELGGNAFRLREPLRDGDTLHVYYQEQGSTQAPFLAPPEGLWGLDLVPVSHAALDLAPTGVASEELDAEPLVPQIDVALDLVPTSGAIFDLVPRPIAAEEV